MRKPILLIGTLAYFIMAVMALVLYKERIAFLDGSFILFSILSENDLAVQVYRFGSAVTQAVPLLASRMDFSLETIMKLYSVCFPVYFFLLFLICLLLLKKERYAILLLLFNVGMVTHTFYWVIPEFQQGLSLMVVYFALLEKAGESGWLKKPWFLITNTGLLATLAFFHPLMICPFAFFVAYFFLFSNNSKTGLVISGILFIIPYLIKSKFFKTEYDSQAMESFDNLYSYFPNYFDLPANYKFLSYLVNDYYLLPLALVCIVLHQVIYKKYLQLLFLVFGFFAYLLLINVSYPDGPPQFYIESLYLPLSLILFLPLVFSVFEKVKKKYLYIGLTIIVLVRTAHIYQSHHFYTERQQYIRDILDQTKVQAHKKLLLGPSNLDMDVLLFDWGLSYEAWLLSTLETGETRSLTTRDNPTKFHWALKKNKHFISRWGFYDYQDLPDRYFILKDTSDYIIPTERF